MAEEFTSKTTFFIAKERRARRNLTKREVHNPQGASRRSLRKFKGDLKTLNIRVDLLKENLRDFQFPSRPKFTLSVIEGHLRGEIDLFAAVFFTTKAQGRQDSK